jgi:hypothetical protein
LSKKSERSRHRREVRAFHKREWEGQDQFWKARAAEREPPPADAERYRPTDATPVSLAPSELEALAEVIAQAIGLKEDPPARKTLPAPGARKVRKPETAPEPEPTEMRGAEIADRWSDVSILLRRAQRPKDSTTETGAERRMRADARRELLARSRRGDDPDRRIGIFLHKEMQRILQADEPSKALRLFQARPGRGHREKYEWHDHDIAVAVEERVARGITVARAVEQVAVTRWPHLGVRHIRKIYYRHRRAARADLALRFEKG